jgi:hypothetical protein
MIRIFNKNNNQGITLIALIITIIVLLILAGISIASLTGQNGILSKADIAKTETTKARAEEQVRLAVLGSYDTNAKLDINQVQDNLNKIDGEVSVSDTNGNFPVIAIVDGYKFIINENGNIVSEGLTHIIHTSDVIVTNKDGSEIPPVGADEGTELKITFTASVENGTITNVEPGTVQDGEITYTTTGTEKEVIFKITGQVENDTCETTFSVSLENYYIKSELKASDIAKFPDSFYGSEVTGYSCTSNGVSKWRIFYADDRNIYLIADDYIHYTNIPNSKGGHAPSRYNDYIITFDTLYNDYSGSQWILNNSLAKDWLNQYFNYTPDNGASYPNRTRTSPNIKAVAYLMDTNIWSIYASSSQADYAIAGPPIEMYCKSYKQTHPTSNIRCDVTGTNGYNYYNGNGLSSDHNQIYVKPTNSKAYATWIASPASSNEGVLLHVTYEANLNTPTYNAYYPGFRPVVCLNSNMILKKTGNEIYALQ